MRCLPTRRFLAAVVEDSRVLVRCRRCALFGEDEGADGHSGGGGGLFHQLVELACG
ncbi:hypothetical protein T492DRAFT_879372, partial [Pavlovales sp. CCMP2436]